MADSRGGHRGGGRGGGGGGFRGRGGGGGGGGGNHRGGRGGGGGHGHHQGHGGEGGERSERPKKENILDLSKYQDKEIKVKFAGGREGALSLSLPPLYPPHLLITQLCIYVYTCVCRHACALFANPQTRLKKKRQSSARSRATTPS